MLQAYLSRLQLQHKEPTLKYLHELICSHQSIIPWENITKIIDTTMDYSIKDHLGNSFIPPIEVYIDRLVKFGTGGTCWTLAKGFKWLLDSLGFDVHYLYMDSGHLCLRVNLDQPYYVDVGYCAPLYHAYPLFASFTVRDQREIFEYTVAEGNIVIKRTPGPTKTLNPIPVSFESMYPNIKQSNDWATSVVLNELKVFGYVDGVPVSINGNIRKEYYQEQIMEKTLDDEELLQYLEEKFLINHMLVRQAMKILREHKR